MRRKQNKWKVENNKFTRLGTLLGLILLNLILSLSTVSAQAMHVNPNNDSQVIYNLDNISKMTFSSGNLTVTKSDKSTGIYTLNELRHLSFLDYSSYLQEINNETVIMQVYPNPVGEYLNIKLPESGKIQILSLDGKSILTKKVTSSGITSILVNHLQTGIYICLYTNRIESKTVKIIKQ